MKKSKQIDNNEINLIDLIITIIEGKWKIASVIVISVIIVFAQQIISERGVKNFTATTEIIPINTPEENKYIPINNNFIYNYNFDFKNKAEINVNDDNIDNTITSLNDVATPTFLKKNFLNLYLEILNEKTLFEDAIRKYSLLDVSKYKDEKTYNEAITKLASTIKIITKPFNNQKKKDNFEISSTIQFIFNDAEKWKSVLLHVDEYANKSIQLSLQNHYYGLISIAKQQNDYKLEDISTSIKNLKIDYERETSDKILFLEEQATIAEKLGIINNTIEVTTFSNEVSSFFSENVNIKNLVPSLPFYLKGYVAINEEIELIRRRTDKNAFIPGLLKLEQAKRSIEQDKSLDRAKLLFEKTPMGSDKTFVAASANISSTTFVYKKNINQMKTLIFAVLIGLLIGIFFVFINKGLQSKK